jgi:hypothetical protein
MGIKRANMNLLLRKVRAFLNSIPPENRKGKKFLEAKKALSRLEKLFAGKNGELELVCCRKDQGVIPK